MTVKMRTFFLIYKPILSLVVLCFAGMAQAQTTVAESMRREFLRLIDMETSIDYDKTPGFIVGIIDGPNEIALAFGTKSHESADTLSSTDLFGIGSATKVLTSTLVAMLADDGAISLDQLFNELLPTEFQNPNLSELTLRNVLTHRSGLPRDPRTGGSLANPIRWYDDLIVEDLLGEYANFPGPSRIVYSNLGYALIEPALYHTQGGTYAQLLQQIITIPLGMHDTNLRDTSRMATGHDMDGKVVTPVGYGPMTASGGLMSNMDDMLTFARFCLGQSPASLWEDQGEGIGKQLRMGLGWHISKMRKSVNYVHTGHTLGHSTFVGINRKTQTAVIILANSAAGTDDLGMEILRIVNDNWKRKS